jgi:hypothetical protein
MLHHQFDHETYAETPVLNHLECFQDAVLALDLNDRRSMSACVHFLYGTIIVSWKITKQPAVAAASTDAELWTLFMATKQTLTFRNFIAQLGYGQAEPT